jgi:AmmeMemoRadiSam system protein A
LEADLPLNEVVSRYAIYAASEDPRFNSVLAGELDQLEIEISVLSNPTLAAGFQAIQTGRDGVVLTKDGHSATFLPQVADEQHWGRDEFLANLCLKAGLAEDCWTEGARFETFQAAVFSESEFHLETQR